MVTQVAEATGTLVIELPATRRPFTDAEVIEFTQLNPELRLEINPAGNLVVMAPAGAGSDARGLKVASQLDHWAARHGGVVFGGTAGFRLPGTSALRSPDAAWISRSRWQALAPSQREGYSPVCPELVVEVRSPTDRLSDLHAKMREYQAAGALMGLLLDPESRTVWVYRPDAPEPEVLRDPARVSGEPVLPGFELELEPVWRAAEP